MAEGNQLFGQPEKNPFCAAIEFGRDQIALARSPQVWRWSSNRRSRIMSHHGRGQPTLRSTREKPFLCRHRVWEGSDRFGPAPSSLAVVLDSPLANNVTSWPRATNSSVNQ